MIKIKTIFLACLALLLITACGEATPVAHQDACDVALDDTDIIVEGYFTTPSMMSCDNYSGNDRCGLVLNSAPNADDGFSADVKVGSGKNHMASIESGFTDDDIVIKTADGETVGIGDHVRVTGEINVSDDPAYESKVCYMYVSKIEQVGAE
jgi:hypothetical protein